jgi:hypothetical protein
MTQVKSKTQYFTQDTEDAIIEYNNTPDPEKRNEIYRDRIHYAFFKLTENIIHTFKYYHTEVDNIENLQHEVIIFLLNKIHLFNPEKGAKAYSYFGTIAKRYLILNNQSNYKKKIETIGIEILDENEKHSYELNDGLPKNDVLNFYIDKFVDYCTTNIYALFPKEEDAQIADAILELFRKREHIDIFNKKALYIYIREIVDAKAPKITRIANQLHKIFKKGYLFYLENGYIKF